MPTVIDAAAEAGPSPDRDATATHRWSAVVVARNEAESLPSCLRALSAAVGPSPLHVTLLLNGSTDTSVSVAIAAARAAGVPCRIYAIPQADKSNAINCFLHELRPPAETYFFVDGYASVFPDALTLLAEALTRHPEANAAAAVPSTGRSAASLRQAMIASPGLHGSLFALRGRFVDRLVQAGIRLPVGLYRGDGLLGAMVMHDLDPQACPWDPSRVVVEPSASWSAPQLHPWRVRDLNRQIQRMIRQAQGRMESAAIREVIYSGGFTALPADVGALLLAWLARDPAARTPRAWRDPLGALAVRALQHRKLPAPASLRPTLLWQSP